MYVCQQINTTASKAEFKVIDWQNSVFDLRSLAAPRLLRTFWFMLKWIFISNCIIIKLVPPGRHVASLTVPKEFLNEASGTNLCWSKI